MYCDKCGAEVREGASYCSSCGIKLSATPNGTSTIQSQQIPKEETTPVRIIRSSSVKGGLVIAWGALMMLIALSLDWYTFRCIGDCLGSFFDFSGRNIGFSELMDTEGLNWVGNPMPIIIMIVLAASTLLSVVYFFLTGIVIKSLWNWFAILSVMCLLANYGYLLSDILPGEFPGDSTYYYTPHAGWALAFIGSLAVTIGSNSIPKIPHR